MPKWAARIWLEITAIRVERLQEISEEDAIAEGIFKSPHTGMWAWSEHIERNGITRQVCATAKGAYSHLWDEINGDGAWKKNPWVWVIVFKRV